MIANLGDKVKQNKQKKVKLRAKVEEDPFDVQAVNPRYGTARMSDMALALMRPQNPKVAAIIEARRDELEDC